MHESESLVVAIANQVGRLQHMPQQPREKHAVYRGQHFRDALLRPTKQKGRHRQLNNEKCDVEFYRGYDLLHTDRIRRKSVENGACATGLGVSIVDRRNTVVAKTIIPLPRNIGFGATYRFDSFFIFCMHIYIYMAPKLCFSVRGT